MKIFSLLSLGILLSACGADNSQPISSTCTADSNLYGTWDHDGTSLTFASDCKVNGTALYFNGPGADAEVHLDFDSTNNPVVPGHSRCYYVYHDNTFKQLDIFCDGGAIILTRP